MTKKDKTEEVIPGIESETPKVKPKPKLTAEEIDTRYREHLRRIAIKGGR